MNKINWYEIQKNIEKYNLEQSGIKSVIQENKWVIKAYKIMIYKTLDSKREMHKKIQKYKLNIKNLEAKNKMLNKL